MGHLSFYYCLLIIVDYDKSCHIMCHNSSFYMSWVVGSTISLMKYKCRWAYWAIVFYNITNTCLKLGELLHIRLVFSTFYFWVFLLCNLLFRTYKFILYVYFLISTEIDAIYHKIWYLSIAFWKRFNFIFWIVL